MRGLPADWLQKQMGSMKLGEILVDHGVINKSQLSCVLGLQHETSKRLGEIIVDLDLATPVEIDSALDERHLMEIT